MIKMSFSASEPFKKFTKEGISRRLNNVARVIGRKLAEKSAEHAKEKITSSELWHVIYRDTIAFQEQSGELGWRVSSLLRPKISEELFKTAKIYVVGSGEIVNLLGKDPWSLHKIPAIRGGYNASILVVPSTEAGVSKIESTQDINEITEKLAELGVDVLRVDEVAKFNGETFVDFLGIKNDLDRMGQKHWGPARMKLELNYKIWAKQAWADINNAMVGYDSSSSRRLNNPLPVATASILKRAAEIRKSKSQGA